MNGDSLVYGLEFQTRALCSVISESEKTKFLVGTQSLKFSSNQVHLVNFNEENNTLNAQIYKHQAGEIWSLSSSISDSKIFASCYKTFDESKVNFCSKSSIWKIPEENNTDLINVCDFNIEEYGSDVKISTFHPNDKSQIAIIVDNSVLIWNLSDESSELSNTIVLEGKTHSKFTTGKWNPLINTQFSTADNSTVRGWDIRCSQNHSWIIENAHLQLVRDLDFNPNQHNYLVTCGDDGKSKFWDLRNTSSPITIRNDHLHWVWCVRYNHYHDELIASASSDTRVLITRIQSISSSIMLPEDSEIVKVRLSDRIIATFDYHEDSAYCVEWSSADPWILASLSYDGCLLINRVPKIEKYRILL